MLDAFRSADQVLLSGVQGITDLITTPGLINLDFADVKSVMQGAGSALMGIGSARGEDRAVQAAELAISSPLLEASIDGAHGVLLSIQGGSDLGLFEINEAARLVQEAAHPEANIIFGAVIDDALGDEVRVTVIAAGFDEQQRSSRSVTVTAVPASGERPPAAEPAGAGGAANGTGTSGGKAAANGGGTAGSPASAANTTTGSAATSSWAGRGTTPERRDSAGSGPEAEPPASATPASPVSASAEQAAAPSDQGTTSGTAGAPATWSTPSTSFSSGPQGGSGYTPSAAADTPAPARPAAGSSQAGHAGAADPIAEVSPQPASDGPSGYVPSPVSFVSEDDDEGYGAKPGYGAYDQDRGGDAAQAGATPSWKDSGRGGKQDKVFDQAAGRRRPVVFEEEDDLDVPDFLK
jgi:cell division protein FtsZ